MAVAQCIRLLQIDKTAASAIGISSLAINIPLTLPDSSLHISIPTFLPPQERRARMSSWLVEYASKDNDNSSSRDDVDEQFELLGAASDPADSDLSLTSDAFLRAAVSLKDQVFRFSGLRIRIFPYLFLNVDALFPQLGRKLGISPCTERVCVVQFYFTFFYKLILKFVPI